MENGPNLFLPSVEILHSFSSPGPNMESGVPYWRQDTPLSLLCNGICGRVKKKWSNQCISIVYHEVHDLKPKINTILSLK